MKPLVMVIDDSRTVCKIIEICLGREDFDVVIFPDGVEAMRWLALPDSRVPNLVFLDIALPKLDGYEVARRLKRKPQFAQTVLIMLTRYDGLLDRLKGRLVGAKEYITKPFKTSQIIAVVKAHVPAQPGSDLTASPAKGDHPARGHSPSLAAGWVSP